MNPHQPKLTARSANRQYEVHVTCHCVICGCIELTNPHADIILASYNTNIGETMDSKELLGMVGGALTSLSMVPQMWQLFKMKSAREISLPFSVLLLAGIICWLAYGIAFDLFPMILWNSVAVVLSAAILFAKLKYGRTKGGQPASQPPERQQ